MLSRGRSAHQVGKSGVCIDQSLRCDGIVVMDLAWRHDDPGRESRDRGSGRYPEVRFYGGVANNRATGVGDRLVGEDRKASRRSQGDVLRFGLIGQSAADKAKRRGAHE